jgi:hypothetical protein
MVKGISEIIIVDGIVGPVGATSTNWIPIVGGDNGTSVPSTFVLARNYSAGRVVAVGHEGLFSDNSLGHLDNSPFAANVIRWLNGTGQRKVFYSIGHGEWLNQGNLVTLGKLLASNHFTLSPVSAPLDSAKLTSASVLIIGNAWRGNLTPNETEVVRQYVANGGGLLLLGLGWSWLQYHAGTTLNDYPMTQIAAPYQVGWLDGYISDPTDRIGDSTVFHTFYPKLP